MCVHYFFTYIHSQHSNFNYHLYLKYFQCIKRTITITMYARNIEKIGDKISTKS